METNLSIEDAATVKYEDYQAVRPSPNSFLLARAHHIMKTCSVPAKSQVTDTEVVDVCTCWAVIAFKRAAPQDELHFRKWTVGNDLEYYHQTT
jgi:hypothetical protein